MNKTNCVKCEPFFNGFTEQHRQQEEGTLSSLTYHTNSHVQMQLPENMKKYGSYT